MSSSRNKAAAVVGLILVHSVLNGTDSPRHIQMLPLLLCVCLVAVDVALSVVYSDYEHYDCRCGRCSELYRCREHRPVSPLGLLHPG
jgi:hypothetical protein